VETISYGQHHDFGLIQLKMVTTRLS